MARRVKSKLKQLLAMVRQVMRDLPFEMSHALLGPNPRLLDHLAPARNLGLHERGEFLAAVAHNH